MKSLKQSLVLFCLAGSVFGAAAQTTNLILETDFDGDAGEGNLNSNYGYCVAGSSTGTSLAGYSGGITPGVGVNATSANSISPNYVLLPYDIAWTNSANTYNYAVVGNGTQFGAPMTALTPTAVPGSFILSADLQVLGLLPQLTNADVIVSKVQFIDGGGNVIFDFTGDAGNIGTNYTEISVPLSSLSYASDATHPITDLTNATVVGSIASFTIEFAINSLPVGTVGVSSGPNVISPPFGFTSTGELNVDNIQLVQTGNTVPTPLVEQLIWKANFDTTFPSGAYGFFFRDGADNATAMLSTNMGGGFGGSDSLEYIVNLSSWSSSPPVSYSGFGVGGLDNQLSSGLTSANKASYRFYFDAKAGNLPPGASTNVSAQADLLFAVPPGTETPPNASEANVFDLNPSLTLTTNWQSFVFDGASCLIGVNNGGSQALFNQYVSAVNQIQVQVSTEGSPNIGAQFGYATNATIDIDNIRVVQLIPGTPPVAVVNTGSQVKVLWTDPATGGTAQLQSSTNVLGPYVNVPGAASGAASPYVVPAGNKQQYFRTVWIP
ncbi:MAG TPA: hypothetical protein VMH87_10825 [Pseudomonadales bacterium]|nr:hypothetical protein [Pseudomonadales bacterium]